MGPRNRCGSGRPLPAAPREKKAKSLFSRFPNPAEGTVSVNEGKTIAHHVTAVFLPEVRRANEGDLTPMSYLRPEIEEPGLSSFKESVSRIGKGVQHLLPG